mmetsp:Transcript_29269/g.56805  ORF Transcript_29269/g.56805 Transcript_29269/m.56805 type:complete len:336 (+) Transcript_29269:2469-3476(+)
MAGYIEVKHVTDRRHIKPARGHIRGDEEAQIAIAEPFEGARALGLVQIAVDRGRVIFVLCQRLSDDIHIRLAVAEDDRVGALFALSVDQHPQHFSLFRRLAIFAGAFEHDHALFDGFRGCRLARDLDPLGVAEERVGDPLNLWRHGGGEEQRLAGKGGEAENPFNIRDKAHVEHPVSFVHDHDFHVIQDQLATFEMVQQTAGRGDQNIDALVDQDVLFLERNTTDQQRFGQFHVLGVGVEILCHLGRQFAGGAQDQTARHTGAGAATGEHCDQGKREAGGLAGARLGDAQNVAPFKGGGNRARLNGRRRFIARFVDGFEDFGVQVQIREFCHVYP